MKNEKTSPCATKKSGELFHSPKTPKTVKNVADSAREHAHVHVPDKKKKK